MLCAGGFFDHQPTPTEGVPAPDDVIGDNGFKYDRLGVRIPASPISTHCFCTHRCDNESFARLKQRIFGNCLIAAFLLISPM